MELFEKGRKEVLFISILIILTEIGVDVFHYFVLEEPIGKQSVRLVLTVLICFFMFAGKKWARFFMIISLIIGVIIAIPTIYIIISGIGLDNDSINKIAVELIILTFIYFITAIRLIFSKYIRAYFAAF